MAEEIVSKIHEWKRADEIKTQESRQSMINNLWNQIGSVTAKCPYCQGKMEVRTAKSKVCMYCGKSYQMYPNKGESRIVFVPAGKIRYLHEIRALETQGHFENIL